MVLFVHLVHQVSFIAFIRTEMKRQVAMNVNEQPTASNLSESLAFSNEIVKDETVLPALEIANRNEKRAIDSEIARSDQIDVSLSYISVF